MAWLLVIDLFNTYHIPWFLKYNSLEQFSTFIVMETNTGLPLILRVTDIHNSQQVQLILIFNHLKCLQNIKTGVLLKIFCALKCKETFKFPSYVIKAWECNFFIISWNNFTSCLESSSSCWNLLFTVRPEEVTVTCEKACKHEKSNY